MFLSTPRPATEPRDGPTRNFHEKYRKNTPRAEILEPQENTQKKNTPPKYQKYAFLYFGGIFSVFGVFGGLILGVQNFGPGGIFSVFFVEIPGRAPFGAL